MGKIARRHDAPPAACFVQGAAIRHSLSLARLTPQPVSFRSTVQAHRVRMIGGEFVRA